MPYGQVIPKLEDDISASVVDIKLKERWKFYSNLSSDERDAIKLKTEIYIDLV